MRKMLKGFTLVELLIVIGVMGILSSMAMVGGSEANNIATANKIISDFRIISSAMSLYYADNRATASTAQSQAIKTALATYMKNSTTSLEASDATEATVVGKYTIIVVNGEWWLGYKLSGANTPVAKLLANKAAQEGLMKATTKVEGDRVTASTAAYVATGDQVYMQVR